MPSEDVGMTFTVEIMLPIRCLEELFGGCERRDYFKLLSA
jgi:hypothetical protein